MTEPHPALRAAAEQLRASDPTVSAFVAAHAGTGKTKLLVDRLLRLMLSGADPARILCLTFTKAAAAEMAIRLQRRLGGFVRMDDATLDAALKVLLMTPSPEARARARALFVTVLDLPGGMRISTIHAFCQSLLRRFPLEAQISPHFRVVEDADAREALDRAREICLPIVPPDAVAALAGLVSADGFAGLVALLERHREKLQTVLGWPEPMLRAALHRAVGVTAATEAALIEGAVAWPGALALQAALMQARNHASRACAEKAGRMLGWLGLPPAYRIEHWAEWLDELFRQDGEPQALRNFCNEKLHEIHPDIRPLCGDEQMRVGAVLDDIRALRTADASAGLLLLAAPILANYGTAKSRAGLMDYDDLIRQSHALLGGEGAAWVKYKLDAGIDHLLLDEVQDSAAIQWDITDALAGDFFAGDGARTGIKRTQFAVGDIKQSIYSFQGAQPDEFGRRRAATRARVQAAGEPWCDAVLDVSFRSTAPVLALVDAVFANNVAARGVCGGDALSHIANRVGQAGSVTLWPLAPRPVRPEMTPWTIPEHNHPARSAPEDLVRHLAAWIRDQIAQPAMLQSAGRPMRAGDMLVLVRRRGEFDRALVRELKKLGVPVAGLDRMVLTEQPAVQDLRALCAALLLPQDDLTFAEMLVSPLGGLSDESLMQLAAARHGDVWSCLRRRAGERPDWQAAHDFFASLLNRVDFASPYALLAEALGPLGGRARLFARLGPEAADPVDEMLAAALHHAEGHAPSLQGFLHWLDLAGAEVKREAEAAGDAVRIMTVHGAKGLEAPVVILPDTVAEPPDDGRLHWTRDPQSGARLFLWAPNKAFRCTAVEALRAQASGARAEEYNRLLYVALTRARDHLLICGWQPKGDAADTSWYSLVANGLHRAGAAAAPHVWGTALCLAVPQTAAPDTHDPRAAHEPPALPHWAGSPPNWQPSVLAPEPAVPRPLAPSRPDGVRLGAVPAARSPLLRVANPARTAAGRGLVAHTLLQYLSNIPPVVRNETARAYVATALPEADRDIAAQIVAIVSDPALAPLFGPASRAEQAITGVVADQIITGRMDRIAVLPDRVLVADFKTARMPPASETAVPVLYLRQMAAYRGVLGVLYPNRTVTCFLIWTEGPSVMRLSDDLLDSHAPQRRAA